MEIKNIIYKGLVIFACIICFVLTVYGITWGLPSRWCIDESIAGALRMVADRTIVPRGDFLHPTFHYFILIIFFLPVLLFLKIVGYPLNAVREAASISWIRLSIIDPKFSTLIYIVARLSSAIFAVLIVYIVYKMAEKSYSKKAGIWSALFLSVTMGFVSEAHTAKSTIFLMFMMMLTLYSCIIYIEKGGFKKYAIPFFLCGLTVATKYNGAILALPLGYYLLEGLRRDRKTKEMRIFFIAGFAFLFGMAIGFPGIITNFLNYFEGSKYYQTRYVPHIASNILPLLMAGIAGYVVTLKDIFGFPLFGLVAAGIFISVFKIKVSFTQKMILLTIIPYYLFFSLNPKIFEVKYIIPIVPLLVLLSSGITELWLNMRTRYAMAALSTVVWITSFLYALSCDEIYAFKDIRYEATDWVKKNVGRTARIIVVGHPEWVIHNDLFRDYDITLLNNQSGAFNPAYNRRYIGGVQYPLNKNEVDQIVNSLAMPHNYVVIYPIFIMRDRIQIWKSQVIIDSYGIDLARQRVVKELFRKTDPFFWNRNIGGYEPKKIIITHG